MLLQLTTFLYFDQDAIDRQIMKHKVYATLLAVSAVFLAMTFIVYMSLPKLRNLHGKTLVCHVTSLLVAYSFLSAVQFATDVLPTYCISIGKHIKASSWCSFSYRFVFQPSSSTTAFWLASRGSTLCA